MMKRIIKITLLLIIMTVGASAQASVPVIEVNGLILGNQYTDTQMQSALGRPARLDTWTDEMGQGREYRYGNSNNLSVFRYHTEPGFNYFGISSGNYSLFNGRLRVGDNISVVSKLGFGKLQKITNNQYYFYLGWDDPLIINVDSQGKITSLQFTISD